MRGLAKVPQETRLAHLRAYGWSSYRGYAGLSKPYGFVDEAPLLALMDGPARKRRKAYRRFVEAGLAENDTEFRELIKASRWGIGGDAFQERIWDPHTDLAGQVRRKEDVSFRRVEPRIGGEMVLGAVAKVFGIDAGALKKRQYKCVARAVTARMLGRYAGMNQRDIGAFLGMGTGSAVCRQLVRLRQQETQDRGLAARIGHVAVALAGETS